MKISNKGIQIVIAVLLLTALFLGYLVLKGEGVFSDFNKNSVGDLESNEDSSVQVSVLDFPPPDASDSEKEAHAKLVFEMAVETDVIDITGCVADPIVTLIATGDSITVKNGDVGVHILKFLDTEYRLEAMSETEILFDFDQGSGIYGYGCDNVPRGAGLFAVFK